jgi:biopolymer transport protein ExbD
MAFGTQDLSFEDDTPVMNEINMTPLVDVMLVLLIVFMITIPVMKHAVNVELPKATSQPQNVKPQTIQLTVDAQGNYFLNQTQVTELELPTQLEAASAKDPQPDLHIRADKAARYEFVAQAMAVAQLAGLHKIGFITEPKGKE